MKNTQFKISIILYMLSMSIGISSSGMQFDQEAIQEVLNKTVDNKKIWGTVINVSLGNGETWSGASGNMLQDDQYFIASTTKLYTSAIIYILIDAKQLSLSDPISKYLSPGIMSRLHNYKGIDYSNELTIKHLLSQTSGLSDYFEQGSGNNNSLKDELLAGNDQGWTPEQAVELSKEIDSHFPPGQAGKAFYSDTNYQLLGKIIEHITKNSYGHALETYIFNPLTLKDTYVYHDSVVASPTPFYYKKEVLHLPLAMASFGPDGGIVSTAHESMVFLRAFFSGALFPQKYLDDMQSWNKIFFPLEYGIGIMRFKLPRIFSPFKPTPEFIGHSGLSGSFAYYCPDKDVYFTGTVNQVHKPGTSYTLLMKLLNTLE